MKKKPIKICIVSSRGGHLYQLYLLKPWWKKYNRFWITGEGQDVNYLLKNEKIYYGYFPETRNLVNAIKNFFLGVKIFYNEKPTLLASCGAGVAPPFFLAGKFFGCSLIFMDSYTFVAYPSLSARLVSLFTDKLLVQHANIIKRLIRAEYWGSMI